LLKDWQNNNITSVQEVDKMIEEYKNEILIEGTTVKDKL